MSLNIQLLEENLVVLWGFTVTHYGCMSFTDALHDMQQDYPPNSEEAEIVKFCRDIAFTKGQIMQLLDSQRTFAGDFDARDYACDDSPEPRLNGANSKWEQNR